MIRIAGISLVQVYQYHLEYRRIQPSTLNQPSLEIA
jgi:hypothetical protein